MVGMVSRGRDNGEEVLEDKWNEGEVLN
jgi:hypothetical protein